MDAPRTEERGNRPPAPMPSAPALSPSFAEISRNFAADLPALAGDAADIPHSARAEGLERDLRRAHQVIQRQREAMVTASATLESFMPRDEGSLRFQCLSVAQHLRNAINEAA